MKSFGRFLRTLGLFLGIGASVAVSEAQTPPMRVLPLGDSLTSGVSTSVVQGAYRNRLYTLLTNAGYVVDYVGTKTDSSNPSLPDTDHEGNGGYRIEQIQAGLAGYLNSVEDPDVILLLAGTNDFSQNFNLASVQTRMADLIADIATRRPFAKIIVANLPLRTDDPTKEAQQVAYNNALPGIVNNQVSQGRQVSLVDMHAAWVAGDLVEGVHPNQVGYNKMADVWLPGIQSVIAPLGTTNPPAIVRTGPPTDLQHVTVRFSKPLANSAATVANFSLNGGLSVTGAVLDAATKRIITLTTSTQTAGTLYTLSVNGVRDRTAAATLIASGSTVAFSTDAQSNGSFELDFAGWTRTGNMEIKNASPYVPTNGSKLLAFNTGQLPPNGVLNQSFATTPGVPYILTFDLGALGVNSAQKLQLNVVGASSLIDQQISITGPGSSTSKWTSQSFSFLANSTTTAMSFGDASTTSNGVDMLLDNVKITAQVPRTLTVASAPSNGIPMTLSPNDLNGNGSANTGFSRQYLNGTVVSLTAPSSAGVNVFLKWQRNGSDYSTNRNITVTLDADYTMNAVYTGNSEYLANGSFENGYTSWTQTGNQELKSTTPYLAYDGTKLIAFNTGNLAGNGVLSQTFNTTAGTQYTLTFVPGVYSFNANPQKFLVKVQGSSTVLSQVVTVNGPNNGTIRWTPQTFTFTANSATSTLSFTDQSASTAGLDLLLDKVSVVGPPIIIVNNPPVAVNDSYNTNQDTPLVVPAIGVLTNDTDTESNPLTAVIVAQPGHGTVTLNANGSFNYMPAAGYSGPDSFTYKANDGNSDSNIATVSITVDAIAVGTITNGSFEQGTPANLGALTGWNMSATYPTAGAPFGYVPDGGYPVNVSDGVRVLVFNGGGDVYTGFVSQTFATTPGQTYSLTLNAGVMSGGAAGKTQRLVVGVTGTGSLVSATETLNSNSGTANLAPKSYTFTADSSTAILTLSDASTGLGGAASGSDLLVDKVALALAAANTAPVAAADSYSATQNVQLVVGSPGVLANDTDAQSNPLTAVIDTNASHGTVALAANGSFTYTPASGYTGPDSFTYHANDGSLNSGIVTVSITVNAPGITEFVVNGSFEQGSSSNFTATGWTFNATYPTGGAPFAYVPDGGYPATPADGTRLLILNPAGNTYTGSVSQQISTTPGATYSLDLSAGVFSNGTAGKKQKLGILVQGTTTLLAQIEDLTSTSGTAALSPLHYSFVADSATTTLTLGDGSANVSPASAAQFSDLLVDKVSITSSTPGPTNTAPTAVADNYSATKNIALVVNAATGVLANDTDPEANPLTAVVDSQPGHGTVTLAANGSFTYTPANNYTGPDSFTYHAFDGLLASNIVTVSLTVNPPAPATFANGSFELDEASWTITGNRTVYTSAAGYNAVNGTKFMIFNGGNSAPNAVLTQTFATVVGQQYDLTYNVGIIGNGAAVQKLQTTVTGASQLLSKLETLNGVSTTSVAWSAKAYTFIADSTATTLTFTDASTSTNSMDLTLDNVAVAGAHVNTAPVAVADSYAATAGMTLSVPATGVLANDTDADSDPLTAVIDTNAAHGTVTLSANGGFTYAPASGYTGPDSFTYHAYDGAASSNVVTVSLTVSAVQLLVNGSFESDEAGWTMSGNRLVYTAASPYSAQDGAKILIFNAGNVPANGIISQTISTVAGQTYTLDFQVSVLGNNGAQQKLQVTAQGATPVFSQLETVLGTGASNVTWNAKHYTFTADSATTVLSFADASSTGNVIDLLLDNVSLTGTPGGPINSAPVANANSYTTAQDVQLVVNAATGVLANDTDAESNPLTAVIDTNASHGTVTLAANGSFTYTPASGYNGPDSFTYHANDGSSNSNVTTVSLTVTPAPVVTGLQNGSFEAGTTSNFSANNWIFNSTFPTSGAPLAYIPDGAYPVTIPDGTRILVLNGGSDVFTGSVSQTFATVPGTTYSLTFNAGVFGNAGKTQRLLIAVNGTASLIAQFEDLVSTGSPASLAAKTYTFTADSSQTTLTFADGSSNINASLRAGADLLVDKVAVSSVTLSTNAPVAVADSFTASYNTPLIIPATGVLGNDTDADNDPITAVLVSTTAHGTLALASNGGFTYTPANDYSGPDSFTYKANDGGRDSGTVTVSITVNGLTGLVNGSFEAGLSPWTTSGGTQYSVVLDSTTGGTDGSKIIAFNSANSANGGVLSQTFATTPGTVYNLTFDLGVLAFNTSQQKVQVTVTGTGSLLSQVATINGIGGGTKKWEAKSFSFTANSPNTTLTFTDTSTTTTNIDMLLDNVKATVPGGGTPPSSTNLLTNPSFETGAFTPWVASGGTQYSVGINATAIPTEGTKSVEFNAANSANGGMLSQTFTTTPGQAYTLAFDLGVLSYNTSQQKVQIDLTGSGSLFSQTATITGASGGSVKWEAKSFTFTANSASTTLKFTDTSTTGVGLDMLLDNVRVTSNGTPAGNTAPTAVADTFGTTQNTTLTTTAATGVLANDVDAQSNPMTAILVSAPASGTLTLNANGSFTYVPATGFTGSTSFSYKANDGLLDSTTVTVTINVASVGTLVNGSFETGMDPWVKAGGTADSVKVNSVIGGTAGANLIEFNSAQSPAGGSLSQSFATVAGTQYIVSFDLGVLAFNTNSVTMNVKLIGSSQIVSQNFALAGINNGTVKWAAQTLTFTANSANTTLTFLDATANPTNMDMLLDNVRVTNANARTLVIDSVIGSSVAMTVSPADNNGAGNGNTLLTRTYNLGTVVNVTAPATASNGATFTKWVKDGAEFATTPATSVTMSANTNLFAVYTGGTNPALGPNIVLNGSFEQLSGGDATNWANVGTASATRTEQPGAASGFTTDGNNILSFNVGGEPTTGKRQQSFATTAGTTYTLQLDVGAYGGTNGSGAAQTLNISVIGNAILLNKNVTVQGTTSTFVWSAQTFTFTADSSQTTLFLADASATGQGMDLFVDSVRVRAGTLAPSTMTVNTTPAAGKAITVATADMAGQTNGTSNFTRVYNTGTAVSMVAPYQNFVKWLKNGQWYATNPSITVTVDASITMTAVYTTTPVVGAFQNGSFEQEFTGWTWTGSQQSVKVKDGLPSTDGLIIIEFNSNSSATDGAIQQTFTTTPGTTYNVSFDMGTKAFNTSQQKLKCQIFNASNVSLASNSYTINGLGPNGDVYYLPKSMTFTANSTTSTITFADQSGTGAGLDLLLDNVKVTAVAPGKAATSPDGDVLVGAPNEETPVIAGPVVAPVIETPAAPVVTPAPKTGYQVIKGKKYLVITITKPAVPTGAKSVVQVSPNLTDWFSGKKHTTVLVDDATTLKIRDNTPVKPGAKRYIRVKP